MAIGKLLFETGKFIVPRAKEAYDLVYAVGVGTAIGIGSNPTFGDAYMRWRGKTNMSYGDKIISRRFKGDVYVEDSSRSNVRNGPTNGSFNKTVRSVRYRQSNSRYATSKHSRTKRKKCRCKHGKRSYRR